MDIPWDVRYLQGSHRSGKSQEKMKILKSQEISMLVTCGNPEFFISGHVIGFDHIV